ncbi:Omega-6 fatty acid desaturase, endoplasmic reticulum isozyme 2 [Pseudolycoriella hygida]|uniref:Omega-6 fatty acid desaturase, endoplasmic reticulum isozyme 2 n=1 Tax=Pseudolycoriella hygida TaxID=35572 RepID=A0A9Q0MNK9_9DIPT|nr:Omega-6 fatty acid desaturase, endoplasmic reticulum isozyme 2 [Pseudolycoriella hygida]
MYSTENPSDGNKYHEHTKAGYKYVDGTPMPQPLSKPQFSLSELRAAIPSHCFERSMAKSFGYLAWNLFVCSCLFYGANAVLENSSLLVAIPGYFAYWFLQASYMTGLFVIGHECGHQAFSENNIINDVVGLILHSSLLVPYFSWKITHRRHHSNAGSCENEEVFVPLTYSDVKPYWTETIEDSPLYNLYHIIATLLLGWPSYLCFNESGPKKYTNHPKSHFNPNASLFTKKQKFDIIFSDSAVAAVIVIVCCSISSYGFFRVLKLYLAPYIIVNVLIVLFTCIQHTDTYIPYYREGEWSWRRGSLCTVDRTLGSWLDSVFHHIIDTHVCHHIFPRIPFYHCQEATEAIKPILGEYYLRDTTPIFQAIWRRFTHCKFVPDEGKVVFYQKGM